MPTDKPKTPGKIGESRDHNFEYQKEGTPLEHKYHKVCDELRKSIKIRQKLVDKLRIYQSAHEQIKAETSRFTKEIEDWRTIQKHWDEIQSHVEALEKERDDLRRKQNLKLNFRQIWNHVDLLTDDECEQLHSRLIERLNYPKQKSKSTRVKKSRRATTGPSSNNPHRHKEPNLPKRHSFPVEFQDRSRDSNAVLNNAPVAPSPRNPNPNRSLDAFEHFTADRFRSDTTQAEAAAPVSTISPFTQEL